MSHTSRGGPPLRLAAVECNAKFSSNSANRQKNRRVADSLPTVPERSAREPLLF
jgi:hypothetical protein